MNERIRELAEQAGYKDLPTVRLAFDSFNKEKFAELIVRECMSLMRNEQKWYADGGTTTYESPEYYTRMLTKAEVFDDACGIIKNHFGVEE